MGSIIYAGKCDVVAGWGILASTILFIVKRDTKLCAIGLMGSGAVAYAVICLFNATPGTYVYAIPILFAAMAYLNMRMVVLGNVIIIIANIIRILLTWSNDSATQTAAFVSMFSLVLMAYASINATRLLNKFNEENMASIKEAAALQEESNRKMSLVAESIIKHFEEAMDLVDGLKKCVDKFNPRFRLQKIKLKKLQVLLTEPLILYRKEIQKFPS